MLYLGVDPGDSGGVAVLDNRGLWADFMEGSATDADLLEFLRNWTAYGDREGLGPVVATVEQVNAMAHGGRRMGATSAFTFGGSWRATRMALTACGIAYDLVAPATWQRAMRCLSKGDKAVTKRRAQELFPGVKVTLRNADALLLAEYTRRKRAGELEAA